jgi:hypothetical protein
MPGHLRSLAATLLSASLLLSTLASAAPSAVDRENARRAYNDGQRLLDEGKIAEAVAKMRAAWAFVRTPVTGMGLVRALLRERRLIEARQIAIQVGQLEIDPADAARYAEPRRQAAKTADELAARIPTIKVVLPVMHAGATLTVAGQRVPTEALSEAIVADPGPCEIVLTVDGRESRRTITLVEGERRTVVMDAPSIAAPSTAASSEDVDASRAPRATLRSSYPAWGWVGLAVGAAGVVTGSVTGLVTMSRASKIDDQCPGSVCSARYRDDLDAARRMGTISTWAFVVGAVGVGVGVSAWFFRSPVEAPRTAYVEPVVGPAFFGVRGAF